MPTHVLKHPSARTLGGVLDEVSAIQANAPAVFYFGETLSYRDLQSRSRDVARALVALGVRKGDRVAALLGNEPDWLTVCFGCAYIGAIFVPLNTWYKSSEIDWTLRHCGMSVLVFAPSFLKQDFGAILNQLVPELKSSVPGELKSARYPALRGLIAYGAKQAGAFGWQEFLALGRDVASDEVATAEAKVTARDIAYILYTSGSTAEPKGVMLNHGSLIENSFGLGDRRNINADDRIWLGSPLFYGLGAANALPIALTHGSSLVLQGSFDPRVAIEIIAKTKATAYYGTGNMTRAILDHRDYAPAKVATMKKGTAGTVPSYKHMTLVEMGVSQASSVYGLTESYGNATVSNFDDPIDVKINTCGAPLPGMEMKIVDPQTFQQVPRGQIGLVLLRGHTTPGYFNNPEETSRALMPDGFFNTGDLGHFDEAGRFLFHARMKEVLKCNGINVSPLEVEQLLIQHPDVKDAHVVGVPDEVHGEVIVAFVQSDCALTEDSLRSFVKERAASFKVPHHVFVRNETQLPRLASGKIAKYKLVEEAIRELGPH
jgi:fatty-acyl-CoA synthase